MFPCCEFIHRVQILRHFLIMLLFCRKTFSLSVSPSLWPLVCFCLCPIISFPFFFLPSLSYLPNPSTHIFFYRFEFPDSSSHSRCSRCRCPQRHERSQSELSHQSQVSHTNSSCSKKKKVFQISSLQFFTSSLTFSPRRSITKTVVNSEIRKEIGENQKVRVRPSIHLLVIRRSEDFIIRGAWLYIFFMSIKSVIHLFPTLSVALSLSPSFPTDKSLIMSHKYMV